jgi:8-oxo-dGTP diphosphatase
VTEHGGGSDDGHPVDLRCSVIVFRGDSVLLCRRTDRVDDFWVLPGGTPRRGEGSAAAARREVAEETGLRVSTEGVAFVLEASSWDRGHHRMEVVFLGKDDSPSVDPKRVEDHLEPQFVPLADLDTIVVRPPIAGYIRGFARSRQATAPYLGNLWRADSSDSVAAMTEV